MSQKSTLLIWTATVALAGLLFGFDTAVISGADQPLQKLWNTSSSFHSWVVMSMALWGTVIGAIFGGYPTEQIGRKKTLFWIGVLYSVSALGSAIAWDPISFSIFRFIGGVGVGASSVAAPIYISEIAPANDRGKLVAAYQFNIVLGILLAFVTNYIIGITLGTDQWRLMLGLEALPAIIYTILVLRIDESPRWLLLHKNQSEQAKKVLLKLNTEEQTENIIQQMNMTKQDSIQIESFWSKKYSIPIFLAFILAFFNQLSGINFVLYYAPRIFEMAGIGKQTALLSSIGIGAVNFIFTYIGVYLIDRLGRKDLIKIGSIGYIISLSIIAWAFKTGADGSIVIWFVFAFIASHAIGQGAVIWVFISEIFPTSIRAYGQSWGTGTHWVFAALITALTLPIIDLLGNNPYLLFAFFAFMMILQLLFAIFIMPETKGVSLEELEKRLIK